MDLASKSLHRGTGTRTVRSVRVAFTLILALSQDALWQPPPGPTSLPAAFSNHPAGHRAEGRGQHARAGAGIPQRRSSVASCSSKLRRRKWSSTRRATATAAAVGWGGPADWDSARARLRAGGSGGSGAARGGQGEQEAAIGGGRGEQVATPPERNKGGREGKAEKGRSHASSPLPTSTTSRRCARSTAAAHRLIHRRPPAARDRGAGRGSPADGASACFSRWDESLGSRAARGRARQHWM
jgi:hypothetical protein